MPIYEYACGSCEHRFETIQRASEEPLRDCPECGDATLKKLLSAPVFRLKGSGWYETDFKTGDKKNVSDAGAGNRETSTGDGDKSKGSGDNGTAKSNGETKPSGETRKSGDSSAAAKSETAKSTAPAKNKD